MLQYGITLIYYILRLFLLILNVSNTLVECRNVGKVKIIFFSYKQSEANSHSKSAQLKTLEDLVVA